MMGSHSCRSVRTPGMPLVRWTAASKRPTCCCSTAAGGGGGRGGRDGGRRRRPDGADSSRSWR